MPANAQCARSRMTARPERNPQAPTRPERGAVPRDPGYGPPFGPTMGSERPKTLREIRAGRHRVVFNPVNGPRALEYCPQAAGRAPTERIVAGGLLAQEFNGSTFKCMRKCECPQCAPELGADVNADSVERRLVNHESQHRLMRDYSLSCCLARPACILVPRQRSLVERRRFGGLRQLA